MARLDLTFKQMTDDLDRKVVIETRNGQVYQGKIDAFSGHEVVALSNVLVKDSTYSEWIREDAVTINLVDIRKYDPINKNGNDETPTKLTGKKRKSKSFATDREYGTNDHNTSGEFQAWEPHEDVPHVELTETEARSGWSVHEMYNANNKLGVKSSFKDLESYSTAEPVGDKKARRRAEKIAKEIENNAESRFNATLENDDEERDIGGTNENSQPSKVKTEEPPVEAEKKVEEEMKEEVEEVERVEEIEPVEEVDENEEIGSDDQRFLFNPEAPEFVPKPMSADPSPVPMAFVHPPPPVPMSISSYGAMPPPVQPLSPSVPMFLYYPPQYPMPSQLPTSPLLYAQQPQYSSQYPVPTSQFQPGQMIYAHPPRLQHPTQFAPQFAMPMAPPLLQPSTAAMPMNSYFY